ncbi:MAG: hypothetical protein EXX96DRAFT_613694 [Benjaminiella poitrasii]|nr:MAG: hypothetical protein EXX96DRAFT_613694 [Benjaminiella poitrasii]
MPRNYYCDFCQCTFPDNIKNRKNHNEGATHKNNRKLHYDWYKDPSLFLEEQIAKPPCRHYQLHGHCEYGLLCKYSHITMDRNTGQYIYPPELVQWFQLQQEEALQTMRTNEIAANKNKTKKRRRIRYKLPSGWKVKNLPPSLKPPPSKQGYDWSQVGSWS